MSRKKFSLILIITLLAAVFFVRVEVCAEYPQDGYLWSNFDMAAKRSKCVEILKQSVGEGVWAGNDRRAAATYNCIQRLDKYYQEHPKDHSLEQATRESLEDIVKFLRTGRL